MQKKASFHFSGVLSENNSSDLAQNCNGIRKTDKMAVGNNQFANGNSILEQEPDATQLPTFFYQRYDPDKQRRRAEPVETDDSDSFDAATSSSSDQEMLLSTSGLKADGIASRGAFIIKKPQTKNTKITATK